VALAARPIDPDDRFLYHKTTRRRAYDEVRAARPGFDDVLLWNTRGELTESTIANVILEPTEGPALTPPISCGLLPGTYRAWLLDQGAVRERIIPVADLKPGCRLVLVNSLRGRREAVLDA
jgi:para-aminobenzoate synthetase/4-amino-4-deoxychorismate lyase